MKITIIYKFKPLAYIEYTPGEPMSKRMIRRLRRKSSK